MYMYIGVAVGSGWQSYVAYINLGCYYIIGLPLGILMQWFTDLGVKVYILLYIMHFFSLVWVIIYIYVCVKLIIDSGELYIFKGIWMGMIFGGTGIQTLILLIIIIRCDWEGEVWKFKFNMLFNFDIIT